MMLRKNLKWFLVSPQASGTTLKRFTGKILRERDTDSGGITAMTFNDISGKVKTDDSGISYALTTSGMKVESADSTQTSSMRADSCTIFYDSSTDGDGLVVIMENPSLTYTTTAGESYKIDRTDTYFEAGKTDGGFS